MSTKRNILLNPGPATTTDTVKAALVVPDICPRENEFTQLMEEIRGGLVKIATSSNDYVAVLLGGAGTAAMESVISTVVPPEKKIAVIVNGAYGDRFIKIAEVYKIPCVPIRFKYGEAIDLRLVEKELAADPAISTVAVIHHETTTGILNPIREIGLLAHKQNCTLVVDAMSSFAGIPMDVEKLKIDYLISSSNKCLQGMAGVGIVIARKTALANLEKQPKRSFYLDLFAEYKHVKETGQSRFTPPVQVLYALRQALVEFFEEGAEARHLRYHENWQTLRSGLTELGFKLFHTADQESQILLTVHEPKHPAYDFNEMHDYLFSRGFTIYPGKISGLNTFRLANLGAIDKQDIINFLVALQDWMRARGLVLQ
jgi:2-aminoethylphosphonate-pyruvate transaminase